MRRVSPVLSILFVACVSAAGVAQAAVIVSFDGTDGLILHGAVRVSTEMVGVDYYDNAPLFAPFESPSVGSARHQHHPAIDLGANIDWNYLELDGVGGFEAAATGTSTTFSFGDLPNAVGTRFAPGTFLPSAAQVGILPSALSLPSGTTIAADTLLYSDVTGLVVDHNDPASYWYDVTTNIEHEQFRGGTWSFFYEDAGLPGTFVKFAELVDVSVDTEIDWINGTVTTTTTGTPVPVSGVILPVSFGGFGVGLLNTAGVLTNETTNFDPATDYVGFYGIFSVDETITFDVENASLVPEPASLGIWAGMVLVSAVPAYLRRRRNNVATE